MRGRFKFQDDWIYKMPVHFGGHAFYPVRVVYGDMTCLRVGFETDPEKLLPLIPEDFELLKPRVNVQYANCREVDWMAGGDYRLIQVSAPVRYMGNSEGLVGEYALVVWENKTCPIIGGREEDGVPKIFADIAMERHNGDHWFTAASYESVNFLKLDFQKKGEMSEEAIAEINKNPKVNLFGWRYLPNLGKGGATLSHATLYPQESTVKQAWTGEGAVTWTKVAPDEHPLQWTIINTLADLPVLKVADAMMMKTVARLNVGDSRILP
ncbi:MAG: acetoacetate decarboxylase family protein [Synergistaceae bacterium]|jgi:acetoacetate decarboxylase|nr:acetoacetate decarboxylase family protein [Synergistaceae bacterium]